jgi:demethylmenaquinone methyltransferase/2-methoxy-6-polyprenyl-1,4-benzoquinol methylase
MSLGSGIRHRRDALRRAGLQPGMSVLDVCSGSGQLARAAEELTAAGAWVVGVDASIGMLREARYFVSAPLVQGFAEEVPIGDKTFDMVTVGYGLRHMADLRVAFREFHRVLRPGGRLLMLELTRPRSQAARRVVRFYIRYLIPALARLMGRNLNTLLEYLWDTIEDSVPPETIIATLADAGFNEPSRFGQIELLSEYTATRP